MVLLSDTGMFLVFTREAFISVVFGISMGVVIREEIQGMSGGNKGGWCRRPSGQLGGERGCRRIKGVKKSDGWLMFLFPFRFWGIYYTFDSQGSTVEEVST